MKIEKFEEKIEIPKELEVKIEDSIVSIKNKDKIVSKELRNKQVNLEVKDNNIIVSFTKGTKREKTMAGTFKAHIKNMFKGALEGHVYKLKICSGHFPMNVTIDKEKVVVNNFLGEKVPRELKLREGVDVKMEGDIITVESSDKELAGQTSADIEILTKVKGKDLRIFQDGIYITEKDGKGII
jgi:large subunit ribosomal protein L6